MRTRPLLDWSDVRGVGWVSSPAVRIETIKDEVDVFTAAWRRGCVSGSPPHELEVRVRNPAGIDSMEHASTGGGANDLGRIHTMLAQ